MTRTSSIVCTISGAVAFGAALMIGYTVGVVSDRPEAEGAFQGAELQTLVVAALLVAVAGALVAGIGLVSSLKR